ncbi:MAG: T9SS type A sorting domain-containing protein [Candidatus Stygibacter australis]|nr:T9SS type A sorting domain-containing protein [Candidatus Stygibacter australis]
MKMVRFVFLILVLSSQLFADGTPAEGAGTENDPYQIAILDNLLWLSTTDTVWDSTYHFLQTTDIDASDTQNWNDGEGFSPIGRLHNFTFMGNYNGGYYEIDCLYINRPNSDHIGFFGNIQEANIEAIGLTNVEVTGNAYVGGLVGKSNLSSSISESFIEGIVGGNFCVGGLVGHCYNTSISGSFAAGNVSGDESIGGLIGYCNSSPIVGSSQICDSYAMCSITGNNYAGGLVGYNIYSTYSQSYYDYETVLINDQHIISVGALTSELYDAWMDNDLTLEITEYLSYDGEYYLINDTADFEKLLAFGYESTYSYKLTEDIDLTSNPDFYIPFFSGTINGDLHTINGLNVNIPQNGRIGLLGYIYEATIENLGVTNVNVIGLRDVGGLAGASFMSLISNCYSTGSVNGSAMAGGLLGLNYMSTLSESFSACSVTGNSSIGGLIGFNGQSIISKSYAVGSVDGANLQVGGLVGENCYSSIISESFAAGNVNGYMYVGGLAGTNDESEIIDSYATGNVIGEDSKVGGLVGQNRDSSISRCYETGMATASECVGGLIGIQINGSINNSIWNIETSGQALGYATNYSGTITNLLGKTTAEMLLMSTYTDISWDFWGESINGDEDIWDIDEDINEGYPFIYDIEIPVSNDEMVIENVKCKIENYPNPFNPVTNICYALGEDAENVTLAVYNIKGQRIWSKQLKETGRGNHSLIWSGEGLASGIYFYMIKVDENTSTGKMIMLK